MRPPYCPSDPRPGDEHVPGSPSYLEGDDAPTREDAEDEVMSTGYDLIWALMEEGLKLDADRGPSDINRITFGHDISGHDWYEAEGRPLTELMAVIVSGQHRPRSLRQAAEELRRRLRIALQPRIDEVYGEMLAEHEAAQEE